GEQLHAGVTAGVRKSGRPRMRTPPPAPPSTTGRQLPGGDMAVAKRKLGNSGLEVGPWAFGGNVFGWTADEPTSFGLLDAFVAAGLNFIDTADLYSRWAPGHQGGESESILGRWLKKRGKLDQVIIATKVGMEMGPDEKGI